MLRCRGLAVCGKLSSLRWTAVRQRPPSGMGLRLTASGSWTQHLVLQPGFRQYNRAKKCYTVDIVHIRMSHRSDYGKSSLRCHTATLSVNVHHGGPPACRAIGGRGPGSREMKCSAPPSLCPPGVIFGGVAEVVWWILLVTPARPLGSGGICHSDSFRASGDGNPRNPPNHLDFGRLKLILGGDFGHGLRGPLAFCRKVGIGWLVLWRRGEQTRGAESVHWLPEWLPAEIALYGS